MSWPAAGGLPDTLEAWKRRIEADVLDRTAEDLRRVSSPGRLNAVRNELLAWAATLNTRAETLRGEAAAIEEGLM